jgi:hypothetical protein
MMSLEAALAQRGRRVGAWASSVGGDFLSIVAVEYHDAKVIAREKIAHAGRSAIERRLEQHGIPIGATCAGCDFVWVCTDEQLAVVRLGAGITLEALGADLVIAGRHVEMRDVAGVQWFFNHDVTHRGVRVWFANGDALTIAEQHDPIDPARNLDSFTLGADWIFRLSQDLAVRLGVALHDETWEGVVRPPAPRSPADAGTDALIDGLVDAHLHWDDPDRVAQRKAREGAREARDSAILDLAYIESGQRGDAPMDVAVAKMAVHFAGRIDRDVPDVGPFAPIRQPLPEIENGGYIALDIKPVETGGCVLELRVESPSGGHTACEVLRGGSTADLARYLREPTLPDKLVPIMERLTEAARVNE